MMETTFQVIFLGKLHPGIRPEEAIEQLISLFGLDRERARPLVAARREVVVKRGVGRKEAAVIRQRLEQAGLMARTQEEQAEADVLPEKPVPARQEQAAPSPARKARKDGPLNPYAAPSADLETVVSREGAHHVEPIRVPARHGWRWATEAFALVREQPWSWTGAVLGMYLIIFLLNLIPFAGGFGGYLMTPILTGGLMLGAHDQTEGKRFSIRYLLAGFSHKQGSQLFRLGIILALGSLATMLIMVVMTGGLLSVFRGPAGLDFNDPATRAAISRHGGFLLFMILGLVLGTVFFMANWFTAVLITVGEQKALASIRLSFKASWKNSLAFLVCGLFFLLLGAGISLVAGIFFFAVTKLSHSSSVLAVLPLIVMLVVGLGTMCMAITLQYTSYRDIFYR